MITESLLIREGWRVESARGFGNSLQIRSLSGPSEHLPATEGLEDSGLGWRVRKRLE